MQLSLNDILNRKQQLAVRFTVVVIARFGQG